MNTENNKLIAEFMEWEIKKYSTPISDIVTPYGQLTENQLKFHLDWNWLMEVVEKIKPLNIKGNYNYSRLMNMTLQEALNIEVVYKHTVSFIEWYNENGRNKN